MIDVFRQNWGNNIATCSSLSTYITFKNDFQFEDYLDFLPVKYRNSKAKLWLSSHKLRIEVERYVRNILERSLRYCELCNIGDIEDEFHFILICPRLEQTRQKYLKPYYYRRPSVYKFTELMGQQHKKVIMKLAQYLVEAFEQRNVMLNC